MVFSLRTLMLFMLAAGVGSFLFNQYVMDRARFKVLEVQLEEEDGYLNGGVSFRCSRYDRQTGFVEYADTVLQIQNVSNSKLMDLKADDEFVVHYRHRDFGPLPRENRYVLFMVRKLGISKDEIVGFVQLDGWAEVLIRGKGSESPPL